MPAPLPLPALHATHAGIWLADGDGDVREASRGEAIARAAETPHIILNAPLVGQRLGYPDLSGLDLLELFAFLHPARFAVPTAAGLSKALGLVPPDSEAGAAAALKRIADRLLAVLDDSDWLEREGAWTSNATLHRLGWGWAPLIGSRLERPERGERMLFARLKQWEEAAERPPPRTVLVDPADARAKLDQLTGRIEPREGQKAMAEAVTSVFAPRRAKDLPNVLLAEAGTGIGKTLAYLAPASLWAEQAGGAVWVSTFTKALQRQLDAEGPKLFADPEERKRKIVIRKGRENYLCLLNLEDALQGAFAGRAAILAQLVGRWAAYSKDGDMVGGDLPGLASKPVPPRRCRGPDRSARRVRLCRLPALPPLLHRARRTGEPRGRHRHRQSCAGNGQCRSRPRGFAGADPVRRGPSFVRCRRFRPSPSLSAGRRRSNCAAGSSAPKAGRADGGAGSRRG